MKRNYKYTIAVDIDGVLADFEGEFLDRFGYANRHMNSLSARYPETDVELIKEFVNSPSTYERALPIFGGLVALLGGAKANGFYVLLITSRPKHLAEVTKEWLEGYEAQYDEIWFSQAKSVAIQEYNEMYPHRKIILLVDDIIENVLELPEGTTGVVWEQPWNDGYYPRARYSEELMRVEIKPTETSDWKSFWES